MKVLSIVVNYRTGPQAALAVRSLVSATRSFDAPIVVVDNDSRDGSYELLTEDVRRNGYDRVEVIAAPRNGGFGYGNNLAIRRSLADASPPDYYFFLNPDAVATEDAVTTLVEFLEGNPAAGLAGSRISGLDGSPHNSAFTYPSPLGEFETGFRFGPVTRLLRRWVIARERPPVVAEVDWVSGASFLVRREVFETVGIFDEQFFLYFEEIDLSVRALAAGFSTWYVPTSHVLHEGQAATKLFVPGHPLPRYWLDSRELFYRKHYGPLTLHWANVLFALGFALFRVRARIQGKPDVDPPNMLMDFLRHTLSSDRRATHPTESVVP